MSSQMILIAGPYRSGTDGDPVRIALNLKHLERAALDVYQRGHMPLIGEWAALPLAAMAGSQAVGDAISEQYMYPVAHRLLQRCDAVYRIEGASKGADQDVQLALAWGKPVYHALDEVPLATAPV
ncbi:DUF4406 domain-containing protein [Silvimonas sp. JCM 19000]